MTRISVPSPAWAVMAEAARKRNGRKPQRRPAVRFCVMNLGLTEVAKMIRASKADLARWHVESTLGIEPEYPYNERLDQLKALIQHENAKAKEPAHSTKVSSRNIYNTTLYDYNGPRLDQILTYPGVDPMELPLATGVYRAAVYPR